jgi:hypothetical protein
MNSLLDRRSLLTAGGALALGSGTVCALSQPARAAAPAPASAPSIITVPIQLRRQRLVLPLWIDGKGPFPGDVILPPNGQDGPAFQWSLYDDPGTVLEFSVRRDGAVKPVRLVLAELL